MQEIQASTVGWSTLLPALFTIMPILVIVVQLRRK